MRSRAPAMPPADRRAALVAATLPLISEHGPAVSTRQIACAAGVAEGTIYRAFSDKDSLIRASLSAAFDPSPVVERLRCLDTQADLRGRVTAAVEILRERMAEVFHLIAAFGLHEPPDDPSGEGAPRSNVAILDALTAVLAQDTDELRVEPAQCARLLRLVVFAGSHPRITDQNPLSTTEIVDLLLHGVSQQDHQCASNYAAPTGG
jgi:AcrR family transcriptional regulator